MNLYYFSLGMVVFALTGCSSPINDSRRERMEGLARMIEKMRTDPNGQVSSTSPSDLSPDEVEELYGITPSEMRALIMRVLSNLKMTYGHARDTEIIRVEVESAETYSIYFRCRKPEQKRDVALFLRGAIENALIVRLSSSNKPFPMPYPRPMWVHLIDRRPEFAEKGKTALQDWLNGRLELAKKDTRLKDNSVSVEAISSTEFELSYSYRHREESFYVITVLDEYFEFYDEIAAFEKGELK